MQRIEHTFTAMAGPCRLRLEVEENTLHATRQAAVNAAVSEVQRLERKYSRYTQDSLTTKINRAAGSGSPIPLDDETAGLLNYAHTLWQESGGAFDLTSGVLRRAWDFKSGIIPEAQAVERVLPLVGWDQVQRENGAVYLPQAGMELDFGGCVKEYAADSAAAVLRKHGVSAALVDLAGDMSAVGCPENSAGWPVGIRHPIEKEKAAAHVTLPEGGLASSGDYERCIIIDGHRYGHILHPHTGWPVKGLVAVSVLASQCLVAGSSATLAMLQSADEALAWLEGLGLPWFAIDAQMNCHGRLS